MGEDNCVLSEDSNNRAGHEHEEEGDEGHEDGAVLGCDPDALDGAVDLFGAEVLADEGGGGVAQAPGGEDEEDENAEADLVAGGGGGAAGFGDQASEEDPAAAADEVVLGELNV